MLLLKRRRFVTTLTPSEHGFTEAVAVEIHDKALENGLEVQLVTKSGKTEFHGEPINTCLVIGPDDAGKIDEIPPTCSCCGTKGRSVSARA